MYETGKAFVEVIRRRFFLFPRNPGTEPFPRPDCFLIKVRFRKFRAVDGSTDKTCAKLKNK